MRALYLSRHFNHPDELDLKVVERPKPKIKEGECLIQVHSSGINQSDAKGTLGFFEHAKLPRIPGRDFAGTIVEGKDVGKKVWGTGGAAGIDTDGTHAEFITLPETALAEVPNNLSLLQAGAQTLPYVTAYYGLVTRAQIREGQSILVLGALGQVGQAAMSISKWKKCKPVALVREKSVEKAKSLGWETTSTINAHYDVILNPLGSTYWMEALKNLKKFGKMVVIGVGPDPQKPVELPLLPLYRANQDILGINTVDLNFVESSKLLNQMKSGFESNALTPLTADLTYPLERATEAYQKVLCHSEKRIVLTL